MDIDWEGLYKKVKSFSLKSLLIPLAVFFVLLALFYFVWVLISNQIRDDQQKKFDNQINRITDLVNEKNRDSASSIYGVQGFFEGSSQVLPTEFLSYAHDLRLSDEFFCLAGMGYIKKASQSDFSKIQSDIGRYLSAAGQVGNDIKISYQDGKKIHYIVKYFYPTDNAALWLGQDYSSDPQQLDILNQAENSGLAKQTPILKSPQDGSLRYDLVAPIYNSEIQPTSTQDRQKKLRGYSFISFNANDCILSIASQTFSTGVSFNFSDITQDANSKPFASVGNVSNIQGGFYGEKILELFGRRWLLRFSALGNYGLSGPENMIINSFPPIGIILCFSIALAIFMLLTMRYRAITIANDATKELRESEAKLNTLFSQAPDAIFMLDDNGRFLDMNKAGEMMYGIPSDELIKSHTIFDFISSNNKSFDVNFWEKFLHDGKSRFDIVFRGPISDQERYVEVTATAHFVPGLNMAIIRDVTHHRETELALKQSNEKMSAMLNATLDAVYFVNLDGTFIAANKSGADRLGKKPEEIVGTLMYDYYPGSVAESRRSKIEEVVKTGEMVRFEDLRANRYLFNSIYPIKDEKGNVASLVIFVEDITERRKAENDLRESEEQYRQMFLNLRSAVAVYRTEDNGNKFVFEDFNPIAEKIEGITKKEVVGRNVTEVFPGSVKMGIVDVLKEVYKTGSPKYFPESLYSNGHQSWRENYIYKLPNGRIVAIYNDITEEVVRKKQLKESEERYRDLVNFSPDAIIVHTDRKIVFANPSAVKLFGAKKVDDFTGKSIFDFVASQSKEVAEKRIEKVLSENVGAPMIDEVFIKFDGTLLDASVITAPLIYGGKKSIQVVLNDITERKSFERKIQSVNSDLEKFKLAVQNASDHIIITDPDAKILYANDAASRITGYPISEIIGANPRLWGSQMPLDFYKTMWKTIKEDKKSFTGEVTNRRKSGETYQAVMSISPILDKKGNIIFFVGIERDVTKERAIDKSKSEFVSLASHQLRTPLSAINWYTEMLLDEDVGKLNVKQKDYLGEIYHSSKRMADLVGSLLNVSRIELGTFAIEPKPTDITEILRSVIKELSHEIKKRHQKLAEQYDKEIGQLNIDQSLMRIVLQNLISNSVKYTPDKGTIKIEVHKIGNDVIISVADTGYGIPESQQSRIFEKFFRADNIREVETDGTGLGLYIVKEIVEKSGGSIWFESKENKGTKFYVSLPIVGMIKKTGTKKLI